MNNKSEAVRVRFAPSPTGHLHVGGARTALYNWLYARSHQGSFVLRVEDTDLSRSTQEAIDQIITSLRWLGLEWDEGSGVGGDYGPYRQMERVEIYQTAVRRLLEKNEAYRCYCTPEELKREREAAREAGKPYIYSGRCRELAAESEEELRDSGREAVIRLRTPDAGVTIVHDLIKGDVEFENSLQGDFILVRSSGVPTYNFAVAVDDAAMRISHVIRGDDHLPNTPKQLQVFSALDEKPPLYAHLPLILGHDRSPLSKRHGASSVEEFRSQGYLREAICNYLALLGWSFDGETTIFSVDELVDKFSLERTGSTAAVFDNEKLLWMNGHYIRSMDTSELALRVDDYLNGTKLAGVTGTEGRPTIAEMIPLVQEKMKTLNDFVELTDFFFLPLEFEEKALDRLRKDQNAAVVLERVVQVLNKLDIFDVETIESELRGAADDLDLKVGKFLQPIRIAVSGKIITPGMFETLSMLGKKECLSRLLHASSLLA
ncbi:MAG: glutamate--tRNA ligase [Thermoleophilia bacterium]